MTDIPTITQEEAVEVRARLCALLLDRDGADFDGEVHITSAEAREVIAALSPNMGHAVGGVRPLDTAPKDGSYFLMIGTNFDGGMAVVHWNDWWYLDDGKNFEIALRNESRLTGWLPLPPTKATTPPVNQDAVREALGRIANGEAFRCQRFAEDDDAEYFLRAQRGVVELARAALATPPLDNTGLDADVAELVLRIGEAEWGATNPLSAEEHAAHVANSVRVTASASGQEGPQAMHGLYVKGTETVICHAGTSPNSPDIARALAGAWNHLRTLAFASGDRS